MRNALTLLVVIALAVVTVGALNHALVVDLDFVAATWTAVSLLWVALAVAAVIVVGGGIAALLARAGIRRALVKVEGELQSTFERLRAAEARAAAEPEEVAGGAAAAGGAAEAAALAPAAASEDATAVAPAAPAAPAEGDAAPAASEGAGPGPEAPASS